VTTRKQWSPDWAVHPGEVVREAYQERGLTLRAFAQSLDVSAPYVSDICTGKRAVSPRFALRLERAGIGTAQTWVRMQADHDLAVARDSITELIEQRDKEGSE
jgi:addiction module HigA family antidote